MQKREPVTKREHPNLVAVINMQHSIRDGFAIVIVITIRHICPRHHRYREAIAVDRKLHVDEATKDIVRFIPDPVLIAIVISIVRTIISQL